MATSETGQISLRKENIDRAVKGFALMNYKLKQVLLQSSSNSFTESYYRETATDITPAGETHKIQGVARGASFPNVNPSWEKFSGNHVKFAAESSFSMEDKMLNEIDVQARTTLRVARAIASQVDKYIYTELSTATGINTVTSAGTWDNATPGNQKPIEDILTGIEYMAVDNYDALSNGYLLLNPTDYTNLLMNSKIINNPSFKTADVVSNGVVGQIAGLKIIVSNNVTAKQCMVILGNRAATWKSANALTTKTIENEGIDYVIRSWEIGQVQVTDPEAIHVVTAIAE